MGRLCWHWAFLSLCPRGYIGIRENKMENTKKGYIGTMRDIKGLYWDNGKEKGRTWHSSGYGQLCVGHERNPFPKLLLAHHKTQRISGPKIFRVERVVLICARLASLRGRTTAGIRLGCGSMQ